jgi:alpha-tubulin suppressor-like RCC1 family protein
LVGSVEALESRYSVANLAALPPAADNTGRFIYVEDIAAYRYSDGTQWTNDYDTTLRGKSGEIWVWGFGSCGQLGDGTLTDKCSPVREFCSATDWCLVSAGALHTAAIKTSGQIWTWGHNDCGSLGILQCVAFACSPAREFCSATDWCQVSAGDRNTAAIKTSGQLWTWGNGRYGAVGDGTCNINRTSPVREFCSATDWCQVSVGYLHTVAIKTSGQLWAWGFNGSISGRLGDGTATSRCSPVREFCSATDWCQVSAGGYITAAIKTSGQLWAWGCNNYGFLGDGTVTNRLSPAREFCSATDWCQVSAGQFATRASAAIKTSGQLWTWGRNNNGQVGDGTQTNRCSPVREFCSATDWCQVSVGYLHTVAIKTNGELWGWGCSRCGSRGDGTTTSRCSPVREFCSATDWSRVSAGRDHTAAIKLTVTKGFNEP